MDADMLKKAKGYALRLFKLRPRSCVELAEKMRGKGYEDEVISRVRADFIAMGYLDDDAFAKAWMQSRLKKYGLRRVMRELSDKGIAKDKIESLKEAGREEYDEAAVVRGIVERRLRIYNNIEPLKRKRRLMDYLLRRGFGLESVNKVLRAL